MLNICSLEGRVALVTGGNGGIGRAVALGMQSVGAQVVVFGRNSQKNAAIRQELNTTNAVYSVDVRDETAVSNAVNEIVEQFGHLDILVNNAGGFEAGTILELTKEMWSADIETHLTGSFLCAKYAAQQMVSQGDGGKIINIGSMYSLQAGPGALSYTTAKTGVLGLTRSLAVDLAPHNIQVNAILPGWVRTDLTSDYADADLGEQIRQRTPAGRWGDPDDLAGTAIFLASAASDFVTGTSIPVDGGYSIFSA